MSFRGEVKRIVALNRVRRGYLLFGTSNPIQTNYSLIAHHFCAVLDSCRNVDEVARRQHNRVSSHADAEISRKHCINLVYSMGVSRKEGPRRIGIACGPIAKLLQLAAHRLLRQDAIFFRIPVFNFHLASILSAFRSSLAWIPRSS